MPESTGFVDGLSDDQRLALTALLDVTPVATVGDLVGSTDNGEGATTYAFAAVMPGYPGWNWTVTVVHLPDGESTVVESELTPAEGALLAPDWVPWSDRMDDYRAAQAAAAEAGEAVEVDGDTVDDDEDDDDDDDDVDTDDDDIDDDDLGSPLLHGGDLDGVDIDELDDSQPVEGSEALPTEVAEGDDSEQEADPRGENPPRVARRRKRAGQAQQHNESD